MSDPQADFAPPTGDQKSGGVWAVSGASIFGDFDTLRLFGGDDLSAPAAGAADSDFSFVSAEGAAVVPVPANGSSTVSP